MGEWPNTVKRYREDEFVFKVRNKEIRQSLFTTSLSQLRIPKVALPKYEADVKEVLDQLNNKERQVGGGNMINKYSGNKKRWS